MFGMSKQPVENEKQMFYYNFLTEIEYYEFMCRVANEYFHVSFGEIEEALDEQEAYMKIMAVQPLELKLYELLSTKFSLILHQQVSDATDGEGVKLSKMQKTVNADKRKGKNNNKKKTGSLPIDEDLDQIQEETEDSGGNLTIIHSEREEGSSSFEDSPRVHLPEDSQRMDTNEEDERSLLSDSSLSKNEKGTSTKRITLNFNRE